MVSLRTNEPLYKSTSASVTQRKLHLMHSMTLLNMAESRSLLVKTGLVPQYDKGYSIQDMMEHVCPSIVSDKEPNCLSDPSLLPQLLRDHTAPESSECIKEEMNAHTDQISSPQHHEDVQSSCSRAWSVKVPLSMEDIYSRSIVLAKAFDKKMWSNYV
ncbi:uncharacterized protein Hap1MRO34_010432 [Clarias gariepinus]